MRAFIAIPIPEEILEFLTGVQRAIRKTKIKASWTRRPSMHLTLRFLGDTEKKDIDAILMAMDSTARALTPFSLSAKGLGVFPGVKKPRVIWCGVKGQVGQLEILKNTLDDHLIKAGLADDIQRFAPHFTLGRFKGVVDPGIVTNLIHDFQYHTSAQYLIPSMVLYKSDLKPSGAVHTPLFEAFLSGMPLL